MCAVCLCLLVKDWSDYSASFSMCLKHQGVQVGQEGVADVQDVPGNVGEFSVPSNRILSLTEKKEFKIVFMSNNIFF